MRASYGGPWMDPRAADPDSFPPPTSPAPHSRYSPDEAMHLYAAIVGPNPPPQREGQATAPPSASARVRRQRRIEQLLMDLDDQHLRELTHYAADRCRREIGKVISHISSWRAKRVERAKSHLDKSQSL